MRRKVSSGDETALAIGEIAGFPTAPIKGGVGNDDAIMMCLVDEP